MLRLALGAAFSLHTGSTYAQESKPPEQAAPQTWTLNCSGAAAQSELACTLSQVLVVKDSGKRVLTAVVAKRDGKLTLNLGLPHGLNLPKGVDIWIDEAARKTFPIVTADQKGSYAMIVLDDALIGALKKGQLLNVAVTAHAGNEIILQLSLTGFSAGFSRL
jgi:invasion protein IalB